MAQNAIYDAHLDIGYKPTEIIPSATQSIWHDHLAHCQQLNKVAHEIVSWAYLKTRAILAADQLDIDLVNDQTLPNEVKSFMLLKEASEWFYAIPGWQANPFSPKVTVASHRELEATLKMLVYQAMRDAWFHSGLKQQDYTKELELELTRGAEKHTNDRQRLNAPEHQTIALAYISGRAAAVANTIGITEQPTSAEDTLNIFSLGLFDWIDDLAPVPVTPGIIKENNLDFSRALIDMLTRLQQFR